MEAVEANRPITMESLLRCQELLTVGTYDEERWAKGERPGTFKVGDYRVANDVGLPPAEVETAIASLLDQVSEAVAEPQDAQNALTIAAYAHARFVEIHPFADGNGRTARLLMNHILLMLDVPPCTIDATDRLAYFGALDCFHEEGDLEPFKLFLMAQTLKTWE